MGVEAPHSAIKTPGEERGQAGVQEEEVRAFISPPDLQDDEDEVLSPSSLLPPRTRWKWPRRKSGPESAVASTPSSASFTHSGADASQRH